MHGNEDLRKGWSVMLRAVVMIAVFCWAAAFAGFHIARGNLHIVPTAIVLVVLAPIAAFVFFRNAVLTARRKLEDANLEMRLRQEELLDVRDDLFIKFLGVYDANYAANSPRLFADRLRDVADVTARVMEAEACHIFLYDRKAEELTLAATNGEKGGGAGSVRVPLGSGIEGWVGKRLEPLMVKDLHAESRYQAVPGLLLDAYHGLYCVPLYVYSNGTLVGVMEVLYEKMKTFTDEEINFFTTLSGILSTTIQNEQLQTELRMMNMELEQWVSEKTEELRASEERYRILVENASEAIILLAESGDIVFANDQAARITGHQKFDLLRKNLFELFSDPAAREGLLQGALQGRRSVWKGDLQSAAAGTVPVEVSAVGLVLMGKRFLQAVIRDVSSQAELEQRLREKEQEIAMLKSRFGAA